MDEKQVNKIVDKKLSGFVSKRTGDTPTDALQLVPKKYVDNRVYAGVVGSNGIPSQPFPSGWTSSQLGIGDYVITHNLSTSIYSLISTSQAPTTTITTQTATNFEIQTLNSAGANTNAKVNFIVAKY